MVLHFCFGLNAQRNQNAYVEIWGKRSSFSVHIKHLFNVGKVMWQLDGAKRTSDRLKIPGFQYSRWLYLVQE